MQNTYLAKHLEMLDSTNIKKTVYTIFMDCRIISTYQQNFQLTFTSSKLAKETEQEAKYLQR